MSEARGLKSEKDMEAEVGGFCFVNGGRGHVPRNVGCLWRLEKARRLRPPKGRQSCQHLGYNLVTLALDLCPPEL